VSPGGTDAAFSRSADSKAGFVTSYREMPGAHYWFIWRQFLGGLAPLLFK
jgi:S-formylglutathione hydrolase FrmB